MKVKRKVKKFKQHSRVLPQLPLEVLEIIVGNLSAPDRCRVSQCSKEFHSLFTPMAYNTIAFEDEDDLRSAKLLFNYSPRIPWTSPFEYMSKKKERIDYNKLLMLTSSSDTILSSLQHPMFQHLRHLTIPSYFSDIVVELLGPSGFFRRNLESLVLIPPTSSMHPDGWDDENEVKLDVVDWIFQGSKMYSFHQHHFALYRNLIEDLARSDEEKLKDLDEVEGTWDREFHGNYDNLLNHCRWNYNSSHYNFSEVNASKLRKRYYNKGSGNAKETYLHYHVHFYLLCHRPLPPRVNTPDVFWTPVPSFSHLRILEVGVPFESVGERMIQSILRTNILPSLVDLTLNFGLEFDGDSEDDLVYADYVFEFGTWLLLRYSSRKNDIELRYHINSDPIEIEGVPLEKMLQPLNADEIGMVEKNLFPYVGPNLSRLCLSIGLAVSFDITYFESESW